MKTKKVEGKMLNKKKGFTILEILVVLSVIAILIGIAIPRFKGMQDAANVSKAKAEMKVYQAAVESYKNNTGAYPATSTTLGTTLAAATPQITAALTDPFKANTDYNYILSASGSYYVIASVGSLGTGAVTAISDAGVITKTLAPLCATNGPGTC